MAWNAWDASQSEYSCHIKKENSKSSLATHNNNVKFRVTEVHQSGWAYSTVLTSRTVGRTTQRTTIKHCDSTAWFFWRARWWISNSHASVLERCVTSIHRYWHLRCYLINPCSYDGDVWTHTCNQSLAKKQFGQSQCEQSLNVQTKVVTKMLLFRNAFVFARGKVPVLLWICLKIQSYFKKKSF